MTFQEKIQRAISEGKYRKEFFTVDKSKIRVHLPDGLSPDAFEHSGKEMNPWSLLILLESVRHFLFSPAPGVSEEQDSYLDLPLVTHEFEPFMVTLLMDINIGLYALYSPKSPLFIDCSLQHVGNTSFRLLSTLRHETTETPYVNYSTNYVLKSRKTSIPGLPDWWRTKYASANHKAFRLHVSNREKANKTRSTRYLVKVDAAETNVHTNWTSYPKYCLDAAVHTKIEPGLTESTLKSRLMQLSCVFKHGSTVGDHLLVETWKEANKNDTLHFRVTKDGKSCCDMTTVFFPTQDDRTADNILKQKL